MIPQIRAMFLVTTFTLTPLPTSYQELEAQKAVRKDVEKGKEKYISYRL